jgi:hypothetical protein
LEKNGRLLDLKELRTLKSLVEGFERAGYEIKAVRFDIVFINIDKLKLDNSPVLTALAKAGYGKIRSRLAKF